MTWIMAARRFRGDTQIMMDQRASLTLLPMRSALTTPKTGTDQAETQVYRPFFVCGIVTVLTVGCLLGAVALLGIAGQASYTASVWTPFVLAHANSQLFGWVGFFVMGFAMQQHGTTLAKRDLFHRVAWWALGTMGAGIALRFAAEPLAQADPDRWRWLGVLSATLQLVAVLLFCYNSGSNRFRTGKSLTWPTTFVFGSLGCLLLVSVAEPLAFALSHQTDKGASISFVAEWFTPLREVQFLGFVAMMIFGVAASKFPGCLGFRAADPQWGLTAFGLWAVGLVLRVLGWSCYFRSGLMPGADLWFRMGGALLAFGAIAMCVSLGVFSPVRHANHSQKFIRAAFSWLLGAGGLLLFEPFHLASMGAPFSHAYTGAIRHAVTVGFISQMIIGVGYHLVTRMLMRDERSAPALWSVFILLNLGNAARVMLEILTDLNRAAFLPMGWTGFIELTGLAIWSAVMLRLLLGGKKALAQTC